MDVSGAQSSQIEAFRRLLTDEFLINGLLAQGRGHLLSKSTPRTPSKARVTKQKGKNGRAGAPTSTRTTKSSQPRARRRAPPPSSSSTTSSSIRSEQTRKSSPSTNHLYIQKGSHRKINLFTAAVAISGINTTVDVVNISELCGFGSSWVC
jgi:hypothetical protein